MLQITFQVCFSCNAASVVSNVKLKNGAVCVRICRGFAGASIFCVYPGLFSANGLKVAVKLEITTAAYT